MRPATRYATSGDVQIAYQVTGDGPIDIVWAPGTFSHLDLETDWPPVARLYEALGAFARLIRFDKRGTGLSDRPTGAATLEERSDDIRAVMDAAVSERAAIIGMSEGGSMAVLFGALHPERTRALALWGSQARWTRTGDFPWGLTADEAAHEIAELRQHGPSAEYWERSAAALLHDPDPAFVDWLVRYAQAVRRVAESLGLHVRAGIHAGEVETAGGDVRGIAVHIAARVAALAAADEVFVTATVGDLIAGSGIELADPGLHTLKGVNGARQVFAVG